MTQEEKQLLLKDLSCRIPYGVILNINGISNVKLTSVSWYGEVGIDDGFTINKSRKIQHLRCCV